MGKQGVSKRGRRTLYQEEFVERGERLALLGYTDEQMAKAFCVSETTFKGWRRRYPEFNRGVLKGKDDADARVAKRLLDRALGLCEETRRTYESDGNGGRRLVEEVVTALPPDVGAAKHWLNNRQPGLWRNGDGGGAVAVAAASAAASAQAVGTVAGLSDELLEQIRNEQQRVQGGRRTEDGERKTVHELVPE